MKANEFIFEDDYWPSEQSDKMSAADLAAYVQQYVEDYLGAPHRASVGKHFDTMSISISIPKQKDKPRHPRRNPRTPEQIAASMREDWRETAAELIDDLRSNEMGDFELDSVGPHGIHLVAPYDLFESTCAGGMATVVGALGMPAFTRNASIYGSDKKSTKKKKKTAKYANSKDK